MAKDNLRVLFVEDDPHYVRLVREALKDVEACCEYAVAENGAEALDLLLQRGPKQDNPLPDLVLLDLNLPVLGGHDVLTVMKSHPVLRLIPVIVLTTSQNPDDIRKSYDLGASGYVIKPTDFEELVRIFKTLQEFWSKRATLPKINAAEN